MSCVKKSSFYSFWCSLQQSVWTELSSSPSIMLFYVGWWMKSFQSLLYTVFCLLSCQLFSLFLMSSNTRLNDLVLSCPIGFFPSDTNSSDILSIVVLFSLLAWPYHCNHFFSNSVNKFWITSSQKNLIQILSQLVFLPLLLRDCISLEFCFSL